MLLTILRDLLNIESAGATFLAVAVVLLSAIFYWIKESKAAQARAAKAEEDKAAEQANAAKAAKAEKAAKADKAAARRKAAADKELAAAAAAKKAAELKAASGAAAATTSSSAKSMSAEELLDAVLATPGFVSAVISNNKAQDPATKGSTEFLTSELDHELFTILRVFRSKQDHQKFGQSTFAKLERDKSLKGTVMMTGKDPNSKARLASLLTPTYMMVGIYMFEGSEHEETSLAAIKELAGVKMQ